MAKLTRTQLSKHKEACDLLDLARDLTYDEVIFVLSHWLPDSHSKTSGAAFFTPLYIAHWVAQESGDEGHILDLCAGIGHLTYFQMRRLMYTRPHHEPQLTAVEINPEFIKAGKKLVPQAHWIEGDIFDRSFWRSIDLSPQPWMYISNPPFGTAQSDWLEYKGNSALMAVEVGLRVTGDGTGVVVLPQAVLPFEYSGKRGYRRRQPVKSGKDFVNTWPDYQIGCSSLDTTYPDEGFPHKFMDTSIVVEIASFEWPNWEKPKPGL